MKFPSRIALVLSLLTVITTVFAAPEKVRVTDPAVAAGLRARGSKLIADYGAFQLLEVDTAGLTKQERAATQVETASDVIRLNARPLDTRATDVKALRKARGNFRGSSLHLVQFAGPIKAEWHTELEQTGVRIIDYIPDNTYLVYGTAAQFTRLQAWAGSNAVVQWEGTYDDSYKVHPVARTNYTTKSGRRAPSPDGYTIQLVDDAVANAGTRALLNVWKAGNVINETKFGQYLNISVPLSADRLDEIARRPEVVSILPYYRPHKLDERQAQIIAGNLTSGTNAVPTGSGYLAWLISKGFSQSQFTNFVVDVTDSGVDNGTILPSHFALYTSGNPSLASRVAYARFAVGTNGASSTLVGCDGHGNLNAHIIGGYDDMTGLKVHTDASGFHYGLGVCPFVKLGSTVIFDPNNFIMTNYAKTMDRAWTSGARISNNSWGGGYFGVYNTDSQIYDGLVRDSSATNAGNQEITYVFAAGNDGPDTTTVTSPGTAKNVIVVGAAENVFSFAAINGGSTTNGEDGCTTTDAQADNANDVSTSSSWGPCIDGRIKPDIMAPGTHITGGVTQTGTATTNGIGNPNTCFDGSGVCGLFGSGTNYLNTNNYFPNSQKFFTTSTGTSHAAPAVSGACALIRQYFINQGRTNPSPALTKAFLMNAGRYMSGGNVDGDTLPSNIQGMGEVNLGNCFDGVARIIRDQVDVFTNTGASRVISGSVADTSKPVRITLAFTDAPGATSGASYKNDLDLIVTIGGLTYYGNHLYHDLSTVGGSADKINNVESIYLPAGTTGNFTITVLAANINSAGVGTNFGSLSQDFALVAYNATSNAAPAPALSAITIATEGCAPTNNAIDAGETVTLNVSFTNASPTATTNFTVTLLASNGITAPSGAQNFGALTYGGAAVSKQFTFTAPSGAVCGGTITNVFQLLDGALNYGNLAQPLRIGRITTNIFSYTSSISNVKIPGTGTGGTNTPASLFPIPATVSGFPGTVAKVTVQVRGFLHTYPGDVDMLLVGPGATNMTMIMSDAANTSQESRRVSMLFDDDADLLPPFIGGLGNLTYVPVNYNPTTNLVDNTDNFSTNGVPPPPGGTNYSDWLTNFVGMVPNGTWSLYIRDNYQGDSGSLTNGYVLNIYSITTNCGSCAVASSADLALSQTVAPLSTYSNNNVSFTLTITNLGTSTASAVVVSNTLPAGLAFVSATPSPASTNGSTYGFALGSLASAAATNITVTARTSTNGTFVNSATVSSGTTDPVGGNNTGTGSVTVLAIPSIAGITNNGANITLSWNALANVNYRVQYKTNLTQATWVDLTGNITTGGSTLTTNLPVGGNQRFYRITAVP